MQQGSVGSGGYARGLYVFEGSATRGGSLRCQPAWVAAAHVATATAMARTSAPASPESPAWGQACKKSAALARAAATETAITHQANHGRRHVSGRVVSSCAT